MGIGSSGSEAKAAIQYKPARSPCNEFGESISFAPEVRFQALRRMVEGERGGGINEREARKRFVLMVEKEK